jgi:MoaA/NifB/PqqE/SkfB family radical SAM enzyme
MGTEDLKEVTRLEVGGYRYPLREWGWTRRDVLKFLRDREIEVSLRTDCAWCPYQRLHEWQGLLKKRPEVYRRGEAWEAKTGHTFRSPFRDTWPASLKELREAFESGRPLRKSRKQEEACRVCRF